MKSRKAKKGIYFTLDSIIAANIILIGLILASSFYINEEPTTHLNYISGDLIKTLAELKISETSNAFVNELIAEGNITRLNNSIIEQIGEFWAEGNNELAGNLTKEFVYDLIGDSYGAGFYINDEELFIKQKGGVKIASSSQKMISGIMKNRTREGYNARASASKIKKNTTDIYVFESEGSGNEAGADKRVEITKRFSLNATNVSEAMLHLAIHYGTAVLNPQTEFIVNGHSIDEEDVDWSYVDYDKDNTHLAYGKADVADYLNADGWNYVTLILFGQAAFHTHLHPGGRISVTYESNLIGNVSRTIKKRTYFDHISSKGKDSNGKSGAWAIQPIFIPNYVDIKSVALHIRGESISNDAGKDNVQIYLNNRTVDIFSPDATGIADKMYNLKENVTEGTNVISVYLNSYPPDFWGDGDTILYSNPQTDPSGSSYVDVEYEFSQNDPRLKYGKIDVSIADEFGGEKSNSKAYEKNFSNMEVFEAFVQPAQLDSDDVSVYVNSQNIFNTPRALAVPSSIYVDANYLNSEMNYFNITDHCLDCEVLPESLLYYTLFVPSLVGYGITFDSEDGAIDNARERLGALLGDYVELVEINSEVIIVGNVPSMWGPAIAEVRVWQ
ncbi:hypothetical protein J4209_00240 [Candidatus Woesearchaeota archaeon]|nr:hypothetical protein [Candidatus Woesearchaeota archaeon]